MFGNSEPAFDDTYFYYEFRIIESQIMISCLHASFYFNLT